VFWLSLQLLSKIFLILNTIQWNIITKVHKSCCKVLVILIRFLLELELSRQIFWKSSNIKFHPNLTNGRWAVLCGWTDRHDEAKSFFTILWTCLKTIKWTFSLSNAIATAHQFVTWITSDWVTDSLTEYLTDWLLCHLLPVTSAKSATSYQKNKMLD
jgi:hypothetical protein